MISNYEMKALEMQKQTDFLSKLVCNEWQDFELHEVEEKIFRKVLEIGHNALELFVSKKGTGKDTFNEKIISHKEENWKYISIFGKIDIERAYFWKSGMVGGIYPIDKELNLPGKHYSYLLQKWNQMIAVDGNFDKAREELEEIFKINVWSKQSEEINREASEYVDKFYDENPSQKQKEPILVVEADGKGIVIRKDQEDKKENKIRLKKGEKNGKKKMSTVTAIFGVESNIRTVEDIIKIEVENSDKNKKEKQKLKIVKDDGPKPQNKTIRATLEGKDLAFERLGKEIEQRDPNKKCERIALMDGEIALEKKAKEYLVSVGFIIILDLFHVMERLWKLCYYFCKEGSDESIKWMKKYLTMISSGKTGYFIGAIRQIISKGEYSKRKVDTIEKILKYFEKRKNYMRYDKYLAKGYPVGSGVIEGACRSFVKDRMELAGMRWTEEGAEAMLELRSIKVNDKWPGFWNYYSSREKEKKYSLHDKYYENYTKGVKIAA